MKVCFVFSALLEFINPHMNPIIPKFYVLKLIF